jgi:hypothetical protein
MSAPRQAANATSTSVPAATTQGAPVVKGWVVGLSLSAGILMVIAGIFTAVMGLTALIANNVYVATPRYIFAFDLTAWGWILLIVGIGVVVAGFGVVWGQVWGRVVGIGLAIVTMVVNFAFIPYYPVWALLIIALSVFVIWALCLFNPDAAGGSE